uniref:Kinesin-like protein n=1 Tax=Marsilea vestita TaxID=59764 RepID=A0A142KWB0_MARVE|nr:kinesin 8-IIa protein [Marsilea vestita]
MPTPTNPRPSSASPVPTGTEKIHTDTDVGGLAAKALSSRHRRTSTHLFSLRRAIHGASLAPPLYEQDENLHLADPGLHPSSLKNADSDGGNIVDKMFHNLQTPAPSSGHRTRSGGNACSPQILGVSNWNKEGNGAGYNLTATSRAISKLAYSCPKPAANSTMGLIDGAQAGDCGQTEMKFRKRTYRDELDTVREDGDVPAGSRIMVYVRMRPLSKAEKESGARSCVRVVNKKDVYLTEFASETDYLRLKRLKGRHFVFDAAFNDSSNQQEVYNTSAAELVEGVLQGRNGSVFCYGATGAGKTHTMLGTTQNPGVMVLALKDLFNKLRQRCREGDYVVRLSYLEVYNESVRDLLSPGRPLVLREDSKQGIIAAGLTQYTAYSADEVMSLLHQGNQNRTTEPTRVNETSSRSHAILQVVVEYKVRNDSHYVCRTGKLSLIDLAGSERALATDQRTIRSLEGANINRSLLALSSCINALVEGKRHIPFRNSKLTQLLKDSLGGACQTSMIANISPSTLSFGETQNTLHWADRAKQIRTKGCDANEEIQIPESEKDQAKLLLEVQKENQQLRMQLARMQQKLLSVESNAMMTARQSPAMTPPPSSASGFVCRTPLSESRTAARHEECRAVEEALRKKIQIMEKERETARREVAALEAQLSATVSNLKREHNLELHRKDDFIRTLCSLTQQKPLSAVVAAGELDIGELPSFVALGTAGTAKPTTKRASLAGGPTARAAAARSLSAAMNGGSRRMTMGGACVPPPASCLTQASKPSQTGGTKRPSGGSVPGTPNTSMRTTRRTKLQQDDLMDVENVIMTTQKQQNVGGRRVTKIPAPPPSAAPKTPISSSKAAALKKRTFWDITNANSPSAPVGRCTRSNTTATPSMLLQPGFLGGGRRRILQN